MTMSYKVTRELSCLNLIKLLSLEGTHVWQTQIYKLDQGCNRKLKEFS